MIELHGNDEKFDVYHCNEFIGTVNIYNNPHHMQNCYVKLDLKSPDTGASSALFYSLREMVGKPLQVMVDSSDCSMIAFLTAGGFTCKRKCYEVNASAQEYVGGKGGYLLDECDRGTDVYETCCSIMYRHYMDTHESVNPWTSDYGSFCAALPNHAVYCKCGKEVVSLAFVEENEIAYMTGADELMFLCFAKTLVNAMMASHERICFEADDTDWAAMMLRSLFVNQGDESFDTYILGA